MRRIVLVLTLALAGLTTSALVHGPALRLTRDGVTDFLSFYTGARLVGMPDLYSPERMRAVQIDVAGWWSPNRLYCRLPYFALLLWPLSLLPFLPAYYLWQALSFAAAAVFVWLWPGLERWRTALACCWSLPLFNAFAQGQDIALVLAAIAAAFYLRKKGASVAAGVALALCAAKFHIFLLLPFWLLAQKQWRIGSGFAVGAAALAALSFAAGGPGWPSAYYALLADPKTNPSAGAMPNLHGVFATAPGWEAVAALTVAGLAVWSYRRLSFEYGFAVTVAAGVLIAHHSYVSDCALLLPAALLVWSLAATRLERYAALLVLAPLIYLGAFTGGAPLGFTRLALVAFFLVLAFGRRGQHRIGLRHAAAVNQS